MFNTDPTIAYPAYGELQVDDVELEFERSGCKFLFQGALLVDIGEDLEMWVIGAEGMLYVGEDDERGLIIRWDEYNTDAVSLISSAFSADDVLQASIAYDVRYP